MELFAGVDIGTSSSKVSVINVEGQVVAKVSCSHKTNFIDEIRIEQNPDDWMFSTMQAFKQLKQSIDLKNIRAIAFTGQMIGLVCINEKGEPVRPAIIWMDQRSQSIVQQTKNKYDSLIRAITFNPINTAYTLPRILWVKGNEPEIWNQTWKWFLPKDYVKFKFCGNATTDFSDASGTLLFDVAHLKWSEDIFHALKIEEAKTPEVVSSFTPLGKIEKSIADSIGLSEDTLIVNGCSDLVGESYVAFLLTPQHFLIRFGSAGSVSTIADQPLLDPKGRCTCYAHAVPNKWIIEASSQGFGVCERWFREKVLNKSANEIFSILDSRDDLLERNPRLIFIPPIKGAPYWEPRQKGAFLGISLDVDGLEMFLAVLEGASFSLKDARNQLSELVGEEKREYLFTGGGSQSKLWTKVLSNALGFPARVVEAEPSIGAAFIAGKALGMELKPGTIIKNRVENSKELIERYNQMYKKYSTFREALIELYS